MDYYKQNQFIARVDKNDRILGKIDKWYAHKNAILHRGFTVIMEYNNQLILQYRKHLVFDKLIDLSFSSHQIYLEDDYLQDNLDAIYKGLKREWSLEKKDLMAPPKLLKKIYYKAKDPNSSYSEHEIDCIYHITLKKLPDPNYNFCYGFTLISKDIFLKSKIFGLKSKTAPWVKKILKEKLV